MTELSPEFLQKLTARYDGSNVIALALCGSYSRGQGNQYSDVDLWQYVRGEASDAMEKPFLETLDGFLVTVKTTLIGKDRAAMQDPLQAIWVVPAIRQLKILLDKDGSLTSLMEAATDFRWDSIQANANECASRHLASNAEEIHKLLDGLTRKDESKTLYAIWSLTREMSDVLLIQRGILVPTENVYIDFAQATAGRDSTWSRQFRLALGLDRLPAGIPPFQGYGKAGLELYRETVALLKEFLLPADVVLVDHALAAIREAGF
jgi:hypothetical protein